MRNLEKTGGLEKQKVSEETLDEFLQEIDMIRIKYHIFECDNWIHNTNSLHNSDMQYIASYLKANLRRMLKSEDLLC